MQNYQRVCRVVDTGGSVPAATSWPPFITQEPLVAMSMGDCSSPPQTMYLGPSPGQEPHLFWEKNPSANPQPGKLLDCVHESNSGRRWFWVSPRSRVAHLSLHSSCFRKVQSLGDRGQPKGDASTAGRNGTVIFKGNQQRQAGSDS